MASLNEPWMVESGLKGSSKEAGRYCRTAHNMSSSSLRKKSEIRLVSKVPCRLLRQFLTNLQEVILGTKLSILFPVIPLAIVAECHGLGRPWVFALSLLGLIPLAERVSFLTEQIAYYTGPTVGGLLNATCGNATELIIAIFALSQRKIDVVKYSLLGSILSNILLVLGTSLICGGLANLRKEQKYDRVYILSSLIFMASLDPCDDLFLLCLDCGMNIQLQKQADVNCLMLLLGLLCQILPLLFQFAGPSKAVTANPTLQLSRASSIVMLIAYGVYIYFQLFTHRQMFEAEEDSDEGEESSEEAAVIGFWSGFVWLVGMTLVIALLSEYVVDTIEVASDTWGLSVSFLSIILLPIVGNASEHAGAIIFAFKNKLDITLGVALGSATQIGMFVVPLCVIVAWIMDIKMDLNLNLIETGSLALAIIVTGFTLQDGTSHYMKGLVLLLCYIVIAACFFVLKTPLKQSSPNRLSLQVPTAAGLAF
ncbi:hypothetical protein SAY87_014801 [Trapa incisa]|uniref:Sodium/calcium exchanger membrane region domain-containing protein n=1 Tax=Trapa incisa TaxID=236973 RepID=A0AAN7GXM4_9MYRT|nr:hypothetical protein SAY87_014801 [Trapa incisa]